MMQGGKTWLRQNVTWLTALAVIALLYVQVPAPSLSATERAELASHFSFTQYALPEVSGSATRYLRPVNPSLSQIAAWISSVGAAVALNDLDGDGLTNDVCYVETRTNQVIVGPAPGGIERYAPFTLDAAPLLYDDATMAPMGCLPGDLNEDGAIDMLVYYWGRTPIAFLQRLPRHAPLAAAHFQPYELHASGERWFSNAATLADLDGDGHVDIVIGNYFADGAHILDAHADSADQMQDSMSRAFNGGRKHFLIWTGGSAGNAPTVSFQDAGNILPEELSRGWTLALGAADLNGDLLPELYIANDFGPDRLLLNQSRPGKLNFIPLEGRKKLGTPGSKALGNDSFKGMGVDFGDLNGDGQLDLFVSNITTEFGLQESNFAFLSTGEPIQADTGIAPYEDRSEALGLGRSGWGWEARLADFNNDGVLEALQATGFVKGLTNRWPELQELAMGNDALLQHPPSWMPVLPGDDIAGHQSNPFFVRASNGRYYDLARDLDLDAPYVSRGIATADVDGDGRLDFAVANQWEPSVVYYNASPDVGRALTLRLVLPVGDSAPGVLQIGDGAQLEIPTRPAIGATAVVFLPDGRRLTAQVDGGNGHSGKRSPELHFGLGQLDANQPLQVDLAWRDANGSVHHATQQLRPGRHTVVLGS